MKNNQNSQETLLFEQIIKNILKEIENFEDDNDKKPNEAEVKKIIDNLLESNNFVSLKKSKNTILEKVAEKTGIQFTKETSNIKTVTISVHSLNLFREIYELIINLNQNYCINLNSDSRSRTRSDEFNLMSSSEEAVPEPMITIDDIIKRGFNFLKQKLEEERCDGTVNGNLVIQDVPKSSKQEVSVELEEPPKYKLIPDTIKFYSSENGEINLFSKENLKLNHIDIFSEIIIEDKSDHRIKEDQEIEKRFLNFLSYFANLILMEKEIIFDMKQGLPIYHIKKDQLEYCEEQLKNNNCMKEIYEKLNHEFLPFADSSIDRPKGIIFYGPPRTGKTFTTSKIIQFLKLYLIYPSLAASDFSHGLQGQSEKMVDNIAKRTEVIPWQLCVLFIDEIDSLAPSRSGSSSNNSQASLIGQFLSVIDGNKKKPNMLIIGTTNRLETMDAAFVQRMDIQIFLGVPNCEIRNSWIRKKFNEYQKKNDEVFNYYQTEFESLIPEWVNMSLNFTADAMKKSLNQYFSEFFFNKEMRNKFLQKEKLRPKQILETISYELERHCIRDNIKLGKYILPKIIKEIPQSFSIDPEFKELNDFVYLIQYYSTRNLTKSSSTLKENINVKFTNEPTRRIFIDLDTSNIECQIQVEKKESFLLDEMSMNILISETSEPNLESIVKNQLRFENEGNKTKFLELFRSSKSEVTQDYSFLNTAEIFKKSKEKFLNKFESKKVSTYHKFGGLKDRTEVLKVLIKVGIEINIDAVLLLDFEYFASRNFLTEEKMTEELVQCLTEVQRYDKSIIMFDLDNLLEITKKYSNQNKDLLFSNPLAFNLDKNEINFTEEIGRPNLMKIIFNFAETFLEKNSNHWVVFISGKTKIILEMKERLKWPETLQDNENIKRAEKLLEEKVCIRCNEVFIDKENALGKCMRHTSSTLYLESEFSFKQSKFQKSIENSPIYLTGEYNQIMNTLTPYDITSVRKQIMSGAASGADYKWFCCKKGIYEKGEIPSMHSTSYN